MNGHAYPVRVDASLDPGLSRWLWLVKWLLAIPHYVVLVFLWAAFVVLSIVAWVAILVTGRYPRTIFDFNVGVLRWSWRVDFYTYGGLGTDRYPPFSLEDRPDYPAHLEVEYPEHLSRGLALVKWWLLAIPHYLVVAFFVGAGWYAANGGDNSPQMWGGGLIGLLVFVAAVMLLFTGRYPGGIFDLVLGLNRWVLRVAAYAALMTDDYPPFRLDLGGTDPATGLLRVGTSGSGPGAVSAGGAGESEAGGAAPGTGTALDPPYDRSADPPPDPARGATETLDTGAPPPPPAPAGPVGGPEARPSRWGPGRVLAVILGCLVALVSLGLLVGGGALRIADDGLRDDQGYLMSSTKEFTSPGFAVSSPDTELRSGTPVLGLPDHWLGTVQVKADARTANGVFVGIAPTDAVNAWLSGVARSVVHDPYAVGGGTSSDFITGRAPSGSPADQRFWAASTRGPGQQTLTWKAQSGHWTLVVMNAAGTAPVAADVSVGATVPVLDNIAIGLLVAGAVGVLVAALILVLALRRRAAPDPGPAGQPSR